MSIEYLEKTEGLQRMQNHEAILIGAFSPLLTQVTMEINCHDCGRPVYVSPYEKGMAKVFCLLCGLQFFNAEDRETITKALLARAF